MYIEGDFVREIEARPLDSQEAQRIMDEEVYSAMQGKGLEAEFEDIRQTAWIAYLKVKAKAEKARAPGAYLRKAIRTELHRYIKALRRDALGHRS